MVEVEQDLYDAGAGLSRLGIPVLEALDELPGDDAERLLAAAFRRQAREALILRATVHGNDELFGKLYDTLSGGPRAALSQAEDGARASSPPEDGSVDPKVAKMVETLIQNFPVQRRRRSAAEEEK
jgi:hypothetical protein